MTASVKLRPRQVTLPRRLLLESGRVRRSIPLHTFTLPTANDCAYRMLNIVDEFTRECLTIRVARKLNRTDVIDVLFSLFILRGVPAHIRSDHGPEFVAEAVQKWIGLVGAKTAYITPGSPWENGYNERFNGTLRREVLNAEWFATTQQAT
jgi:putative transposase